MDNEKRRAVHQLRGTRVLDDPVSEKVAYLIGEGTSEDEVRRLVNITADDLEKIKADPVVQRRIAHLDKYFTRKHRKVEAPKNHDEYQDFALKQLWRITRKAVDPKIQVDACKALAVAVKTLRNAPAAPSTGIAIDSLKNLTDAFGGDPK